MIVTSPASFGGYDNAAEIAWLTSLHGDLGRFRIVHAMMPYDPIFATMQFIEAAIHRAELRGTLKGDKDDSHHA